MKGLLIGLFCVLVAVLWFQQETAKPDGSLKESEISTSLTPTSDPEHHAIPDIDIDGIVIPNDNSGWLNPEVRILFDYFVSFYETSENHMWSQFEQHCQSLAYCDDLRDLFTRYIEYKTKLHDFDQSHGQDIQAILSRFEQRQSLQASLFTHLEQQVLFAEEQRWDEQAIARMAIQRDDTLDPKQKADLLKQHYAQLPEQMRKAIIPTQKLRLVDQLLVEHNQSDNQQFNALAAEFGEAAATRLMEVKYQQHTWQLKVAEYKEKLSELNQLYADSPEALETQVTELRETLFDANEQKRLRVALKQG